MNTLAVSKKEIEQLIKHTVREAVVDEFTKLRTFILPYISPREQLDIETRYGKKPSRKAVKSFSFNL